MKRNAILAHFYMYIYGTCYPEANIKKTLKGDLVLLSITYVEKAAKFK